MAETAEVSSRVPAAGDISLSRPGTTVDSSESSSGDNEAIEGLSNSKAKWYKHSFCDGWLKVSEFAEWLKKNDDGQAICTVCNSKFKDPNKRALMKHSKSDKHTKVSEFAEWLEKNDDGQAICTVCNSKFKDQNKKALKKHSKSAKHTKAMDTKRSHINIGVSVAENEDPPSKSVSNVDVAENEDPPSKSVELGKGDLVCLSKAELLKRCQEQDAYIKKGLVAKQPEKAKIYGYNGHLYLDKDLTMTIAQPIYKAKDKYYFDEGLSTSLEIVNLHDVCNAKDSLNYDTSMNSELVSACVDMDANVVNGVSGDDATVHRHNWDTMGADSQFDVHIMWTSEETKFLIRVIKDFVTKDQENLPKTLTELEIKIPRGRGKQKQMWLDISERLTLTFMKQFDVKRVARKWQTLTDGLKKVLSIRSKTGKTPIKFAFLSEMMELIDNNSQDIESMLSGAQGPTLSKSEELKKETVHLMQKSQSDNPESTNEPRCERTAVTSELNQSSDGERVSPVPSPSTLSTDGETSRNDQGTASPVRCTSSVRSRKRHRTEQSDDSLLQYLRESDARMEERQDRILAEMAEFRGSFMNMFDQLLKKM